MKTLANYKVLHNASSSVSNGEVMDVSELTDLKVCISGTATTFKLDFEASMDGVNWYSISGADPSYNMIPSTSTKNVAYDFGVLLDVFFRAKLSAVTGGYITVIVNGAKVNSSW